MAEQSQKDDGHVFIEILDSWPRLIKLMLLILSFLPNLLTLLVDHIKASVFIIFGHLFYIHPNFSFLHCFNFCLSEIHA